MTDGWQKADIVGKILIGVAGLGFTAIFGFQQITDRSVEKQQRIDAAASAKEDNLKREFRDYYGLAHAATAENARGKTDLDMASTIAQTLAAKPYAQGIYLDAVLTLRSESSGSGSSDGAEARAASKLQAAEAQSTAPEPATGNLWFAVVASYPDTADGLTMAKKFADRIVAKGLCSEIWKTRVSNNYAVVLGTGTTRSIALVNAQQARTSGLAPDAFTQVNRQWAQQSGNCSHG